MSRMSANMMCPNGRNTARATLPTRSRSRELLRPNSPLKGNAAMSTNPWLREYRPLSVAHRGHSIAYPENTLEAYRKAIELGVEMIECDVNITSDGKQVMMHDPTLDRTTTGTGRVSAATWEEIQQLDAGGKFKLEFAGVHVPSTEETLMLYKEAGIPSCFEVKGGDSDESNRIALELLDLFMKHDMLETAFMSSYHHEALQLA